jgi:hypothetical protein
MKDENATFCNGGCRGLLHQTSRLGYEHGKYSMEEVTE